MAIYVIEEGMRRYLARFNSVYQETARTFVPKELRDNLFLYPKTFGSIIGYVSTEFGAGFEYIPEGDGRIEIRRSSSRVEDMFFGAPASLRNRPPLISAEGAGNRMIWLNLDCNGRAFPLRLAFERSSISLIEMWVQSEGWRREVAFAQLFGNRTAEFWSEANAAVRAKDEVLWATLDIRRAEIRSLDLPTYLRSLKEKTVLLLGDYGPEGLLRLKSISDRLQELGYDPILMKDIPDIPEMSLQQKAVAVGSACRFVVVDDSSVSGHLVEFVLVDQNRWPLVVLRLQGSKGSFMTKGQSLYSTVILEKDYDMECLNQVLSESSAWIEQRIQDIRQGLASAYPWRPPENEPGTDPPTSPPPPPPPASG